MGLTGCVNGFVWKVLLVQHVNEGSNALDESRLGDRDA